MQRTKNDGALSICNANICTFLKLLLLDRVLLDTSHTGPVDYAYAK